MNGRGGEAERARVEAGERERLAELAETLRRSLEAPAMPGLPGMRCAAYRMPAQGEQLGGDFYDVFPLPHGTWGMFLGDVTGKGAPAAALTSLVRYTLRTVAILDLDPAHVLRDLNTVLLAGAGPDDLPLCTALYARLRPPASAGEPARLTAASAGHPPPIVVRAGGGAEPIECAGLIAGLSETAAYGATSLTLSHGDSFVLYSDGVTDAEIAGERLNIEGLCAALSGLAETGAEAVVDRMAALLGDDRTTIRDDAAALVVSVG